MLTQQQAAESMRIDSVVPSTGMLCCCVAVMLQGSSSNSYVIQVDKTHQTTGTRSCTYSLSMKQNFDKAAPAARCAPWSTSQAKPSPAGTQAGLAVAVVFAFHVLQTSSLAGIVLHCLRHAVTSGKSINRGAAHICQATPDAAAAATPANG
jgi:hypothetical protein